MSTGRETHNVLKKNRHIILGVLLIPVFGVIAALVLISILGHSKLVVLFIVVGLVLIQYLGLVVYIWRKLSS